MEPNQHGIRGYKFKLDRDELARKRADDPAWQGYLRMVEIRRAAMRKALETGERYRDPFADRFP